MAALISSDYQEDEAEIVSDWREGRLMKVLVMTPEKLKP